MFKEFLLIVKYPYTAGIIAVVWLGSAGFLALADDLDLIPIIALDLLATVIIAGIGFNDKKEI